MTVGSTADGFAVLAGSTVTNTGSTTISGDLGVSPGTAVTGFPPGMVSGGTTHAGDAVAQEAQSDVTATYVSLAGMPCNVNLAGQDLGGLTLTPGVYCFPSTSAVLTGQLTLDAQGDPNAVFVFQIGTTLTTSSGSSVVLVGGQGLDCNVLWQVGTSAILGSGSGFIGSVLALASITVDDGVSVSGRLLARTGAVTMTSDQVSTAACAAVDAGTGSTSSSAAGTGGAASSSSSAAGAGGAASSSSSAAGTGGAASSSSSSGAGCACSPAGAYCQSDAHCCSGSCKRGICYPPHHVAQCPQPVLLGSTNLTPPYAFDDDCAALEADRQLQYGGALLGSGDEQPADLGAQCEAYCTQSGDAACGQAWSLTGPPTVPGFVSSEVFVTQLLPLFNLHDHEKTTGQSATCYTQDGSSHRWLALCACP